VARYGRQGTLRLGKARYGAAGESGLVADRLGETSQGRHGESGQGVLWSG
jgi:hypothetical protein